MGKKQSSSKLMPRGGELPSSLATAPLWLWQLTARGNVSEEDWEGLVGGFVSSGRERERRG